MNATPVISTRQLQVGYSKDKKVLHDLNLNVPEAAIYGFLGANGAGKSTTIRSILGLLQPTSGSIQLFGQDLKTHRQPLLGRIGSLIESPSLYLHLSGRTNLKIACRYWNLPEYRIDEVLGIVNLQRAAYKKAKQYSTGMKQRLGLAIALLSDPDLLILDEPTNGLDPNGIIEIRTILQELQARGKTIFLSSHLLTEVEKIVSQVGILKGGKLIFQGTMEELEQLRSNNICIKVISSNAQKASIALKTNHQISIQNAQEFLLNLPNLEKLPTIIRKLVRADIDLYEVSPQKNNLEDLFINLTA
ncbi:MAG: ATP-binding cassette domain-containing protein [Bacteroidota bacterium]